MKSLIRKLVETPSPSGYESQIRAVIRSEVEPLADELHVDNLGSLIARKGQVGPGGLKIMLSAHMDEIGVMATHVDEKGFVRFMPVGAVYVRNCLGSRVRFLNGASGVIGYERVDDNNRLPAFDQMFIDVGAGSRAECPVQVGDVGVFDRPFIELGQRLVSKAMDNRISVAILIETLRQLAAEAAPIPNQVFFAFTVQEEVGVRGATAAAFGLDPDLGLAVDVTATGDTPKGIKMEVSLGQGPAIKVRDQGLLADPRVVSWMVAAAERAGIPHQMEVLEFGTTDARAIQLVRAGVPAGCLSIPCRYIHSPSEMVDYSDVQNGVRLLVELLKQPVQLGEL